MSDEVLRTPEEWIAIKHPGKFVMDPDGWRGPNGRPFTDRISEAEFTRRFLRSTVGGVNEMR